MKVTDFVNEIEKVDCVQCAFCADSDIYVYFSDNYIRNIPLLIVNKRNGSFSINDTVFKIIPKITRKKLIRLCTKYALSSRAIDEEKNNKSLV